RFIRPLHPAPNVDRTRVTISSPGATSFDSLVQRASSGTAAIILTGRMPPVTGFVVRWRRTAFWRSLPYSGRNCSRVIRNRDGALLAAIYLLDSIVSPSATARQAV